MRERHSVWPEFADRPISTPKPLTTTAHSHRVGDWNRAPPGGVTPPAGRLTPRLPQSVLGAAREYIIRSGKILSELHRAAPTRGRLLCGLNKQSHGGLMYKVATYCESISVFLSLLLHLIPRRGQQCSCAWMWTVVHNLLITMYFRSGKVE